MTRFAQDVERIKKALDHAVDEYDLGGDIAESLAAITHAHVLLGDLIKHTASEWRLKPEEPL